MRNRRCAAGVAAIILLATAATADTSREPLPGATPWPDTLRERVASATAVAQPRTAHFDAGGTPRYTNRLIFEASPYLLQHAHNPVDWYPWGDAAFAAAREQGKPVLLSIGYSTCHWCHVMEAESFDNVEIARYINANYIAIKVDREERPDIDRTYIAAVEAMTGSSGWPLTVWLTADREPFYGSTYLPPRDGDRGVREGFLTVLTKLRRAWDDNGAQVEKISVQLAAAVRSRLLPAAGGDGFDATVLDTVFAAYAEQFDDVNGGLRSAPKFASHLPVRLLLREHRRTGDADALRMATVTLDAMAAGGLFDQVGGGFHRYAVDARWRVPHLEKMLYDNALLALAYLEAFQATGNEEFAATCRATLDYLRRDMWAPEGAFYAATDADSKSGRGEAVEGWFYTWALDELEDLLQPRELDVVVATWGVTDDGDLDGRNVLYRAAAPAAVAARLSLDEATVASTLAAARTRLYQARAERSPPFRDPRILTSWNGLAIGAFARAAQVFNDAGYLETARAAAGFVIDKLYAEDDLKRYWLDGKADGDAFADDYAYTIQALLDLYQASGELGWLQHALELQARMVMLFWDDVDGGFFFAPRDAPAALTRDKPAFDSALPSANSVAVMNLLRLHELTIDDRYREQAERTMAALSSLVARAPAAAPDLLQAVEFRLDTAKAIVLVTPTGRRDARVFLDVLGSTFQPNHVLSVVQEGEELDNHARLLPLLEGKRARDGKATAYVCEHGICELPTTDPAVFAAQIGAGQ